MTPTATEAAVDRAGAALRGLWLGRTQLACLAVDDLARSPHLDQCRPQLAALGGELVTAWIDCALYPLRPRVGLRLTHGMVRALVHAGARGDAARVAGIARGEVLRLLAFVPHSATRVLAELERHGPPPAARPLDLLLDVGDDARRAVDAGRALVHYWHTDRDVPAEWTSWAEAAWDLVLADHAVAVASGGRGLDHDGYAVLATGAVALHARPDRERWEDRLLDDAVRLVRRALSYDEVAARSAHPRAWYRRHAPAISAVGAFAPPNLHAMLAGLPQAVTPAGTSPPHAR